MRKKDEKINRERKNSYCREEETDSGGKCKKGRKCSKFRKQTDAELDKKSNP